jgi:undecaprenyl diphosphate synthase
MLIQQSQALVQDRQLRHIAIIMDGNRRWAQERELPSAAGHQAGVTSLKNIVQFCSDIGLHALTVYAFSTENWKRTDEEVSTLMRLFAWAMAQEFEQLHQNQVRITFIGDLGPLPSDLKNILLDAMERTKNNTGLCFQVATNYGSRAELLQASRQLCQRVHAGELQPQEITEEHITQSLYTTGLPEPDILIRTGGETRLSNFLLWQLAYSELFMVNTFWPEFTPELLYGILQEFGQRQRRYGQ